MKFRVGNTVGYLSRIDPTRRRPRRMGIPILLKQYLKMGAKMLSFNRDPDFSDVVDGLIVVDLTCTEPRLLEKYMTHAGYAAYMQYHAPKAGCRRE